MLTPAQTFLEVIERADDVELETIDLTRYIELYDKCDTSHDMQHINAVMHFASELAQKYARSQRGLVFLSALMHDIGHLWP